MEEENQRADDPEMSLATLQPLNSGLIDES
jgi:hypothetical protein